MHREVEGEHSELKNLNGRKFFLIFFSILIFFCQSFGGLIVSEFMKTLKSDFLEKLWVMIVS